MEKGNWEKGCTAREVSSLSLHLSLKEKEVSTYNFVWFHYEDV